jgi:hypothetical protein
MFSDSSRVNSPPFRLDVPAAVVTLIEAGSPLPARK